MTEKLGDGGHLIAVIEIEEMEGNRVGGRIIAEQFPDALRDLMNEYQTIIETQVFSLTDEYEDKIDAWKITFRLRDATDVYAVRDLQIVDMSAISFEIVDEG